MTWNASRSGGLGWFASLGSAGAEVPAGYRSGHVRPLALSPGGDRLLALNTPDNRLAIYTIGSGGLSLAAEVPSAWSRWRSRRARTSPGGRRPG